MDPRRKHWAGIRLSEIVGVVLPLMSETSHNGKPHSTLGTLCNTHTQAFLQLFPLNEICKGIFCCTEFYVVFTYNHILYQSLRRSIEGYWETPFYFCNFCWATYRPKNWGSIVWINSSSMDVSDTHILKIMIFFSVSDLRISQLMHEMIEFRKD